MEDQEIMLSFLLSLMKRGTYITRCQVINQVIKPALLTLKFIILCMKSHTIVIETILVRLKTPRLFFTRNGKLETMDLRTYLLKIGLHLSTLLTKFITIKMPKFMNTLTLRSCRCTECTLTVNIVATTQN